MKHLCQLAGILALIFIMPACNTDRDEVDTLTELEQQLKDIFANAQSGRVIKMNIVLDANSGHYMVEDITTKGPFYFPLEISMHPDYSTMRVNEDPKWKVVCADGIETLCVDEECVAEAITAYFNEMECIEPCPVGRLIMFKS